jgi:amino acid adenylation domain-containing protein
MREFIKTLAGEGIQLYLEGEKLKLRSFRKGAEEPFLAALRQHRDQLVSYLKTNAGAQSSAVRTRPKVERRRRTGESIPASFAQQRLWFLDRLEGGSAHYSMPSALRVKGRFEEQLAEQAFGRIIARHEPLRTVFASEGEQLCQVIREQVEFHLKVKDLRGMPTKEQERVVRELARADAQASFDLSRDVMVRASLVRLADEEGVLLFNMHHIASDGWSMGLLVKEFVGQYESLRSKSGADALGPLAIRYADYAQWQRSWLSGAVLQEQLGYWQQQLAELPPVHSLGLDRARPVQTGFRGARHAFAVEKGIQERLKQLAQERQATLFMVLHAALSVLLARHSNSTDIVVGTPVANRMQKELEELIGFFVNTLVLRTQVSGNPRFDEFLEQVKGVNLDAQSHQDVPFEYLVERLNPVRSTQYSPLFQIMLSMGMQEAAGGAARIEGLELSALDLQDPSVKFDLAFAASETSAGLACHIDYNAELFEAATVECLAHHFERLLRAIAADPSARVYELSMLGAQERHYLLHELNATEVAYPLDRCAHELFETQVVSSPDRVAVVCDGETLTYRQLNQRANQLAHYLVNERRVTPESLVGICLMRSTDMIVAILGILKAGGAYVPLDPEYPKARLAYMMTDASLGTVLTQRPLVTSGVVDATAAVCLDDEATLGRFALQPVTDVSARDIGFSPRHLAYVIYTSGSTGNPKGVMIEHASLVNLALSIRRRGELTGAETILQFSTINFDLSIADIFGALCNGSRLVIRSESWSRAVDQFWEQCAAFDVNILDLPTAYWHELAKASQPTTRTSVRQINIGGEQVNPAMVAQWHRHGGHADITLHNVYGPTECTVDTTVARLVAGGSTIGKPIENYSLYVLGPGMSLVPFGAPGELHVAGVGLARGYLNRADLTAERFVANPFHDSQKRSSSSRLYKTGDLVRYLPTGELEFLGRVDGQVKIRGFRVEVGEIESQLAEHDSIGAAVVVARNDAAGEKRLVAYVIPKPGANPGGTLAGDLRTHLQQCVPDYMVPAHFVVLDELPLTVNGKVDHKALPAPEATRSDTGYVAPETRTEKRLAEIWAQVLHLDRVGLYDNFFELGGHSLLAVTLVERLRQAGMVTSVRKLFGAPTIAGLVQALEGEVSHIEVPANRVPAGAQHITPEMLPLIELSQLEIDRIVAAVPGGTANVQDIYPLAPLQEGILFHYLLQERGDVYLLPTLLAFDERAKLDAFMGALQQVVDRHDILRTALAWEGLREPVQVVWRHAPVTTEEVSLDPEGGDVGAQLNARFDPAHYRMDVRQAPLTRTCVANDPVNGRWLLKIVQHHLISDHTTLEIIIEEIQAILAQRPDSLTAPVPFRNFIAEARLGLSREEHEAFFSEMLADVTEPTAPFGLMDVQRNGAQDLLAARMIGADLAARLRRQASGLQVSAASLMHLAWAQVLARLTDRQDVVFGTVMFGRMRGGAEVDRAPGVFINTLPIRVTVGADGVAESVRCTHRRLTSLVHHEHAPLALAQRCSGVEASAPLFTTLLNYRHTTIEQGRDANAAWSGVQILSTEEWTNYPITISIDDVGDGFMIGAHVQCSLDPARLLGYLEQALIGIAQALESAPQTPALDVEVLPASEREQLLVEWNRTAQDFAQEKTLHGLLDEQAQRTPGKVAVVFEGKSLTYKDLDARASRLAEYLRSLGVGPDRLVGLCVERSLEMVVGLLGILKAGGAYVPLDPGYPQERLAYMLEDARPALLLSQQSLCGLFATDVRTVCIDGDWPEEPTISECVGQEAAGAEALAYVIYTSGSTGKPKAVGVTHRNVNSFLHAMRAQPGIEAHEVLLAVTPLSFDIAGLELFLPLTVGATTVIASRRVATDPEQLAQQIARYGVTMMQATPSTWRMLVDSGWHGEGQALKVLCGGEALPLRLAAELLRRVPVVWNLYGPTETTIWSALCAITDLDRGIPIGRPIAHTQVYLLDGQRRPVPVGVAGEVYIAGAGVARGYVNRPDLTNERFVSNPFGAAGSRMYRTGDRARYREDGNIEYLGRVDRQVKVLGFRIELGEIESCLAQHEDVREAAVVVREVSPGDKRLAAYLTTHAVTAAEQLVPRLKSYLESQLPEYMVPATWTVLEKLPLTANGKVNHQALPAPDASPLQVDYVAPQTDTEQRLAAIWRELLQVERVGIHDNFFELGGHSLLAITLIERMRQGDMVTSVRALFGAPTIAGLIQALGSEKPTVEVPPNSIPAGGQHITPDMLPLVQLSQEEIDSLLETVPGGAANVQDIYPLAPLQEGILFHHLVQERGDVYILATLLAFDARAGLDAFVEALQKVIARHDILRTAFGWEKLKQPVQVVWRHAPAIVEEVSLDMRDGEIAHQLNTRYSPAHYRMDVSRASLLRGIAVHDASNGRWLLYLMLHHLVGDHMTLETIASEISILMEKGEGALTTPAPFREFVAEARRTVRLKDDEAFFHAKLSDIEEPTAPFGLLDVHGDNGEIEEAQEGLEPALARRVYVQARRLGVSAASLFHAAWSLVVARTSGRDDVVFGSVLFGRFQRSASERTTLGAFINTLPLRIRLHGLTAGGLVEHTQRELAQLLSHEQASLAMAQRCSGVVGSAPLFTALLNYRHSISNRDAQWDRVSGVRVLAARERTNYPITLSVDDLGGEFVLTAQTDRRIDPHRITGFLHTALRSLVDALERAPQTLALTLSVLPELERQRVVELFNATQAAYPQEKLIHELFEEQVQRTPGNVAVMFGGQSLTYSALNERANQLAHYLRARGVGPDQLVGLCLERSLEMVVGLLGILKAGGAYVPLDPTYPAERLAFMLNDAAPCVLLTQERLKSTLPPTTAEVIALDHPPSAIGQQPLGDLDAKSVGLRSSHLAYVIYTSGSTGQPKGAMNEHRALINRLLWMQSEYQLTAGDQVLQKTPVSFDVSVWEFFWTLLSGASLVMARPRGHQDPIYLMGVIEQTQVTTLHFVPSMLRAFLSQHREGRCSSLRQVICSGEELPASLQRAFFEQLPQAQLHNLYGPTEAAIDVTAWKCRPDAQDSRIPIGQPIWNTRMYVLDGHRQPVPIGVAGEIYIGGAGVARGYLNRRELTKERFLPDPFSAAAQARLYRTGDMGCWRADGALEYLGRNDHQVKIRGFRIELGEIEAQLVRHPDVKEAAVVAREGVADDMRLVAYLVPQNSPEGQRTLDVAVLRAHLKTVLPEHMVPSVFAILDQLPLTPSGKLDRRALPAPDPGAYASQQYVAPQGENENAVAAIWSEVLGLERVGVHDNFFELGGHSLLAITLVERLRQSGRSTSVRTLFGAPTIAGLLQALANEEPNVEVPPSLIPTGAQHITPEMLPLVELTQPEIDRIVAAVPAGAANVQDIYPLAPLQEGILFHHLLQQQGDVYLLPTLLAFNERVKLDEFVEALQQVIDRHDILRTAFAWEGLREPVQVVWRHAPATVEEVDLDPTGGAIADQLSARYSPAHHRLDVRSAPLLHCVATHDAAGSRWLLSLMLHHLVGDHVTLEIIESEVALLLGNGSAALGAPVPFRDFVAAARRGVSLQEHEAFFRAMLSDIDEPTAPFDLADVHSEWDMTTEARQQLDATLAGRIRGQARKLGVTPASVMHVAWAQVLARLSDRQDVVFGTMLLGRMRGSNAATHVPGLFANALPVRVSFKDVDVEQCVRRIHALLTELVHHEHAPLALAQRCSAVSQTVPLFTAMLNYRHSTVDGGSVHRHWSGVEIVRSEERTNYPLSLAVDDLGVDFSLTAHVSAELEPGRICRYMQTALESLVEALESTPQTPALEVEVLPASEREQLLVEWNRTAQEFAQEKTLHGLFEEQAQRTPGKVAVVFEGKSLTYGQLDARANRLAEYLRSLGVGRDRLVGLCVERSLEMVVGLLGILKAGGAYVPLDPGYPQERLAYMLEDAQPALLLSQQSLRGLFTTDVRTVCIDGDWEEPPIGEYAGQEAADAADAEALAYVIYTSGSTGKPKGVGVTHRNVNSFLHAMRAQPGIEADEVLLAVTPLSFDIAGLELFLPLMVGATTVIASRRVATDPEQLAQHIAQYGVTMMQATPSTWRMLVDSGWHCEGKALKVLCGGEALPLRLAAELLRRVPVVWNLYGPTETTIWSAQCAIRDLERGIPIGRPIANTQIYLLDSQRRPVPVGVAGEVYIAGAGVARGYVNRAELTAERFVQNPFDGAGSRMYRTGDRARYREDGNIEYLGRVDRQVKVRGFRIELGEIESCLARHEEVREAVVVVREVGPGDKRLAAYLTTRAVMAVEQLIPKLKSYLEKQLPEYMVPATWTVLEKLPLTANGKVNHQALPAPDASPLQVDYVAPQTDTEQRLAAIWCELLQVERVGIHDNFFDLGGHSLLIVRLHGLLQGFQRGLSVVDLFRYPSIHKLAQALDTSTTVAQLPEAQSVERARNRRQSVQRRSSTRARRPRQHSEELVEDL